MGKAHKRKRHSTPLHKEQLSSYQKSTHSVFKYSILIVVLGIFVYWKIFTNNFVWDDQWQIIDAKNLLSIQNIPQFFTHGVVFTYRPLFFAHLAIINSLFGLQPVFFHTFNVLLHLTNAVLVFLLFRHFFTKKVALVIALFFLIHPMNVEPTANISFMMEPLYFFFGMIALLMIRSQRFLLGAFFVLLSLFSKESGFIFLPIIVTYAALFHRKNLVKVTLLLLSVLGVYLFMRLVVAGSPILNEHTILPYEPIQRLTVGERLLTIPAIFSYYITTFFFPLKLAIQQYWVVTQLSFTNFYLPLIALLSIAFGFILFAKRLRAENKEHYTIYLFFLIWFCAGILFHFQILPLTMTVADRWFYLPMVGLLGIISIVVTTPKIKHYVAHPFFIASIIVLLSLLSIRSIVRTYDWHNNYTLYSHDVQVLTDNYSLHNDVGAELLKKAAYPEAKKHIEKSIALAPDWWINWTNLATYHKKQNNYEQAKYAYEKAITNGNYKNAYINYANMYLYDMPNSTESAITIAKRGLKNYPENADLWETLALANYQLGHKEEAIQAAAKAYDLTKNQTYKIMQKVFLRGVELNLSNKN